MVVSDGRRVRVALAVFCAVLCSLHSPLGDGNAHADESKQSVGSATIGERADILEHALKALSQVSATQIARLRTGLLAHIATRCQGSKPRLVVRCVIEAANLLCPGSLTTSHPTTQARCKTIIDIAATNFLGESSFVPAAERTRLVETAEHFRVALDRELTRRYARLALSMMAAAPTGSLTDSPSSLARAIDGFCVSRARQATLSYQRCSAALVWFIASDRQPGREQQDSHEQQGPP